MSRRGISRRLFLEGCTSVAAASAFARVAAQPRMDLAHDANRPQFHLLPAANWMNDPNGPIYWKGRYHMFCQYNPHAAIWGDMHWAHAVSPDMVHWRHLPVALAPTPGGPDQDGCFSGSAVDFNGTATFIYTGVKSVSAADATLRDGLHNYRETQCMATSTDPELKRWRKRKEPVVAAPPAGMKVTGFRDPCPWKEADGWYMAVGSGIAGEGGAVLLYRSHNLQQWEYLHPLFSGAKSSGGKSDPVDSGDMWECPDFFALGSKHVLLYSTGRKVFWRSGEYDAKEHRFHPQQSGQIDYGDHTYYAPKSMLDAHGNRVLWGWVQETRPETEYAKAGWAGLMSLPRVLSLNGDGELEMRVAPALEGLRSSSPLPWQSSGRFKKSCALPDLRAEVHLRVRPLRGPVQLTIGVSGAPAIHYDLDATHGSLIVNTKPVDFSAPASEMQVALYLDGSVIEVFVNNRLAHTSRVYDLDPAKTVLTLEDHGMTQHDPTGAVAEAVTWQLRPISPNRLTT